MAFPSPTLPAPTLSPFELSYGGLVFGGIGAGGRYKLQTLTVDMPDIASGDVQRALDQGEFPGLDILPGADITIVQAVSCGSTVGPAGASDTQAQALDQAVQALGAVFGPAGSVEAPLWLALPSGTFCRMARPRKHNCPLDLTRVFAGGTVASTLLHCTDPRWYRAPTVAQTVALPAIVSGGVVIPVTFPALFGSGSGASVNVVNAGPFETRPVLVVTGPCTNPVIANTTLPGSPFIAVNVALNAGDTLTIDTDWQSVILQSAGSSIGASRRNALGAGTTWWNLPANSSSAILFSSADTDAVAGTLTIRSASGWLSL